jgi:rhodanese-related sulfurtransferase
MADKIIGVDSDVDAAKVLDNLADYRKECIILDVREEEEYRQGHIPGAVNIPLSSLHNRMQELKKDQKILSICLSGGRAGVAAKMLKDKGYRVRVMSGGMRSWKGALEK